MKDAVTQGIPLSEGTRRLISKNLVRIAAIEALLSFGGCSIRDLKLHVQDASLSTETPQVAKPAAAVLVK